MKIVEAVAAQAIIGTQRQAFSLPEVQGPIGELLRAAAASDAALLRAAGILDLCAGAGYQPPATADAAAPACAPERLRAVDDRKLESVFGEVLVDGPERLQVEVLRLLAGHGCCLPFGLLPRALELGRRSTALRAFLLPALGQRGAWLADQNANWSFALGAADDLLDNSVWESGSFDQRNAFIRHLRAVDVSRARSLVLQSLAEFGSRDRAMCVAATSIGISADDEAFLETALQDRSKEVRQAAADGLARLPDSRYCARMTARIEACLTQERKMLRTVLALEPPESFESDWKNEAIEDAKAQNEKLGPRAWWLLQIVRAVPLAWWSTRTQMTAEALFDWSRKSEWRDALWRGWLDALQRAPDTEWAEAFLAQSDDDTKTFDRFALIGMLPAAKREVHWWREIERHARDRPLGGIVGAIVASMPLDAQPVSADFARKVLALVKKEIAREHTKWDYPLRSVMPEFVCLLPDAMLDEAAHDWPVDKPESQYFSGAAARIVVVAQQRSYLHAHPLFTKADS